MNEKQKEILELSRLMKKYNNGFWSVMGGTSENISHLAQIAELSREQIFEIIQAAYHAGYFIVSDNKNKN